MKKTIITTTIAISVLGFAFAETQIEAMPAREMQRANIIKAKAVGTPSIAITQAMSGVSSENMMDLMTTGDKAVDEKVRALMKERNEKMKAIQEEYQAKIKALIGERTVKPKGQNGRAQEMEKKIENTQDMEAMKEAYKKKVEAEQQRIERMKNNPNAPEMPIYMDKEDGRDEGRRDGRPVKAVTAIEPAGWPQSEIEAPTNPFSKIQGMFRGIFGN